ncbi:Uncharacterized protein OBRU01_09329 [Operophtera brumata]|uniref:Ig-like domain-containing protein n=1 Tax=Operophtera brumata TaxID=104452 RepID=A0A0L7LER9_OPEBR|nr:Uncharacterized protein OBRU01_09329 [Operophtera brumata]
MSYMRPIQPSATGLLECILATLAFTRASASDKRPHFAVEPPSRLLWPATRGAYALCRANGHPTPDIHWVTNEGQLYTTIPGLRASLSVALAGDSRCIRIVSGKRPPDSGYTLGHQ